MNLVSERTSIDLLAFVIGKWYAKRHELKKSPSEKQTGESRRIGPAMDLPLKKDRLGDQHFCSLLKYMRFQAHFAKSSARWKHERPRGLLLLSARKNIARKKKASCDSADNAVKSAGSPVILDGVLDHLTASLGAVPKAQAP